MKTNGTAHPKLTPKQEAFVTACLNGANKSDAYRQAYNTTKMTDKQIWEEACKLSANPKVSQRLSELHKRATEKVVLTRAWILERLMRNADKGDAINDLTASNKALELLGKTDEMRLFLERSESDNRHHHSGDPVSLFDGFLAEASGSGAKSGPEDPVPN